MRERGIHIAGSRMPSVNSTMRGTEPGASSARAAREGCFEVAAAAVERRRGSAGLRVHVGELTKGRRAVQCSGGRAEGNDTEVRRMKRPVQIVDPPGSGFDRGADTLYDMSTAYTIDSRDELVAIIGRASAAARAIRKERSHADWASAVAG